MLRNRAQFPHHQKPFHVLRGFHRPSIEKEMRYQGMPEVDKATALAKRKARKATPKPPRFPRRAKRRVLRWWV